MTAAHSARARSFGAAAAAYDRYRPGYPTTALDWVLPAEAREVADVGAGTGKLARALVERGLAVHAVEPDTEMLDELARRVPAARRHVGGAEELPFPDASLDAVLVGQAWHWVDTGRAVPEVRRVLRAGGRLALLWNTVVADAGWPREVVALDPDPTRPPNWRPEEVGLPAGAGERAEFRWDWRLTPDDLVACLATHSSYALVDSTEREERLSRVRAIATAHADADGLVTWPHVTLVVRWEP